MNRHLGQSNLIRWQSRRPRRARGLSGAWMMASSGVGVLGLGLLVAQTLGGLHLPGPPLALPVVMIALAAAGPLVTLARTALAWMAG
jgi:hypothetical protein